MRIMFRANVFGKLLQVLQTLCDVTSRAIQSQRGREETHRVHELIDGNCLHHLDIFEDLSRQLHFFLGRRLSGQSG